MFKQLKTTNENVIEIIVKSDFKILDRLEYNLNNPKDRVKLLFYIRRKLGLEEEITEEAESFEYW